MYKFYELALLNKSNTLNFRYGLGQLIESLTDFLQKDPRFTIVKNQVQQVRGTETTGFVSTGDRDYKFHKIISTLPSF